MDDASSRDRVGQAVKSLESQCYWCVKRRISIFFTGRFDFQLEFLRFQWETEKPQPDRAAMRGLLQMVPRVMYQLSNGKARPIYVELHFHVQELFADWVRTFPENASP